MSMFLLMLFILLTKEVFGDNDTICATLYVNQRSSKMPENCTIIEGDLTIEDVTNTSSIPLNNLKSIKVIIGNLEIKYCFFRNLNFLSGIVNVTGSINIHHNTELLCVEHFFTLPSSVPHRFNFEKVVLRDNPKICLLGYYLNSKYLGNNLENINDAQTRNEIFKTSCEHHCSQQRGVQEGCKYLHGDLILENIDESQRSDLKKYMDIEIILDGALILRNNTGIKKLEAFSELKEIYPNSMPNETVAIEISDNLDMKMNFHEISILSFQDLSEKRTIKMDADVQLRLLAENLTEGILPTTPTKTKTTTEGRTVGIEVTTTLQEETTTVAAFVALELFHLVLAGVLGVIGLLLVLSAVLLWNYIVRIKKKAAKEIKSREQFYAQTPTYSHRLEIDSDTPILSVMSPITPK